MVATKQQALKIVGRARKDLERLYGERLRGVYLYGSAARDQLTPDSDIDIAIVLDKLTNRYAELKRTSKIGSDLTLDTSTLVMFFFVDETDFRNGRFSIHRAIQEEGIQA
jgi:predicted nucleotidyltransferase